MLGQRARKLLNSCGRGKVIVADDVPVGNVWPPGTESCHKGVGCKAIVEVDSDLDMLKFRAKLSQDVLDSRLSDDQR